MTPKDPQAAIDGLLNHADWTDAPISSWAARDAILALFQAREQQARIDELERLFPKGTNIVDFKFVKDRLERLQNKTNDGGRNGG